MVPFWAIMTVSQATSSGIRGIKFAGEFKTEWLRVNDAVRGFGLSRPFLFSLIATAKIRSVHIKRADAKKGIRLIDAQSLRDYIGSFEAASK
jgi:hypothetical protein